MNNTGKVFIGALAVILAVFVIFKSSLFSRFSKDGGEAPDALKLQVAKLCEAAKRQDAAAMVSFFDPVALQNLGGRYNDWFTARFKDYQTWQTCLSQYEEIKPCNFRRVNDQLPEGAKIKDGMLCSKVTLNLTGGAANPNLSTTLMLDYIKRGEVWLALPIQLDR